MRRGGDYDTDPGGKPPQGEGETEKVTYVLHMFKSKHYCLPGSEDIHLSSDGLSSARDVQ